MRREPTPAASVSAFRRSVQRPLELLRFQRMLQLEDPVLQPLDFPQMLPALLLVRALPVVTPRKGLLEIA